MLEKKIGSKMFLLAVMAMLVLFLSACASSKGVESGGVQSRMVSPDAPQVAVLPFENLTDYPNADQILTRLMGTELYRQGVFQVREERGPGRELRDAQRGRGEISAVTLARQLASELGADAVLLGSVTEYRYQHGLHEEPVVGLSVRMVRACDGRVVWASSQSESGRSFLHRDSLNQVAQRVARKMAAELLQMDSGLLGCITTAPQGSGPSERPAETEGGN